MDENFGKPNMMVSSPSGSSGRGRSKYQTRKKILDAARTLFVDRGFHDTRPQDIARAAGIGHGTFYLHFQDKKECYLAFVDEACAQVEKNVALRLRTAEDWPSVVDALLSAIFEFADTYPGVLFTALTDPGIITAGDDEYKTLITRWGDQWADLLARHIEEGSVYADYDPQIIGHAVVGAIQQSALMVYRKGTIGRDRLLSNLKRFLTRAMSPCGHPA